MWYTCERCDKKYFSAATKIPIHVCEKCAMRDTVKETLRALAGLIFRGLCILAGLFLAGLIVHLFFHPF